MDSTEAQARDFWIYFSSIEEFLRGNFNHDSVVPALNEKISQLGFAWEVGPGRSKKYMLCISPSGSREKLQFTKKFVSYAPAYKEWEIHHAKQIKDWSFRVELHSPERSVDFQRWEYLLYKFPDGVYDVLLKPDPSDQSGDERYCALANILLDSEIGEEKRILLIDCIEIVREWDEAQAKAKNILRKGELQRLIL